MPEHTQSHFPLADIPHTTDIFPDKAFLPPAIAWSDFLLAFSIQDSSKHTDPKLAYLEIVLRLVCWKRMPQYCPSLKTVHQALFQMSGQAHLSSFQNSQNNFLAMPHFSGPYKNGHIYVESHDHVRRLYAEYDS